MTHSAAVILVVDDEPQNRKLLQAQLRPEGYLTLGAASGEEALSLVAEQTPDLILLDVMMPGMDGYEVARLLKANSATSNIPIIMVTALIDRSARMAGLNAGVEEFLTKPVDRAELWLRVRNLLRLKAYGDLLQSQSVILEQQVLARTANLQASESRFRQMAENIRDAFFLIDAETLQTLYVSPAYEEIWGRSRESAYVEPEVWAETIHPDDRGSIVEKLRQGLSERDYKIDFRIVRPDGSMRWIGGRGFPIRDEAGKVVRLAGIAEDITDRKHVENQLRWRTAFFEALVKTSADGILVVDAEGTKILQNPRFNELWKIPAEILNDPDDGPQLKFITNLTVDAKAFAEKVAYLYAHPDEASQDEVALKDGTLLDRYSAPVLDQDDHFYGRIWSFRDITERRKAERRIAYLNRVYAVLSGINALIVRVRNRDELFEGACRIAVEHGGFRMALIGMVDRTSMRVVPLASAGVDESLLSVIKDRLTLCEEHSLEFTVTRQVIKEKNSFVINDLKEQLSNVLIDKYTESWNGSLAFLPLIVSNEGIGMMGLYAREIDFFHDEELKLLTELGSNVAFAIDHIEKSEKLDYLSSYDPLTGLANRGLFLDRAAQHMRDAENGGYKLALLLIDVERFKNINDSLGRAAGDALLRQVAEWLVHNAGGANLLARIGADQFAIVMPEVKSDGGMTRFLKKKQQAFLRHPFHLNDGVFRIAFKNGIALFPDNGHDADTVFKNAEAALKKAKAVGEPFLFYTKTMTAAIAGKLSLENQLRDALDRGEFVLHYQPKGSFQKNVLTGAEALIRWNDPRGELVPPARFIPVLEETGLIHEVGRWAVNQAIEDYLRWHRAGLPAVRIAVNVSPLQLRDRGFVAEIRDLISVDPQAPAGLELEITESLIMEDVQRSITSLRAIRDLGVTIAIDDFGTGFSSLSYLAKLPVDALKVDRSFVAGMNSGPEGLALVSTIIKLAHSLKLKVVAEGVETEEQFRLLRLLDCDEMQGFLFSKAVPGEIFEARFLTRV